MTENTNPGPENEGVAAILTIGWAMIALPWLLIVFLVSGQVFPSARNFMEMPIYSSVFVGVIYGAPFFYVAWNILGSKGARDE